MWRKCGVLLVAWTALANAYLTHRDELHINETLRTPSILSSACDECQVVVRRLADVAKNPSKIAELKAILLVLCDETSYKEECRMFVNRLDLFLDKLLPYLQNPHEICCKLHICRNKKLQSLHDIGEYFVNNRFGNNAIAAKALLCDECQFAVDELKTVINDERYETEVKEFISHEVCAHLGRLQGICDSLLEEFLPDFWQALKILLHDSNKLCAELKMCKEKAKIVTTTIYSRYGTAVQSQLSRVTKVSKTLISALLNY